MSRGALIALPLLALGAALWGVAAADRPLLAAAVALVAGMMVAGALHLVAERRLQRVADRVVRLADGAPGGEGLEGGAQWRRLEAALDAAAVSLRARFADLAGERARIERLLDGLPLAVLLFDGEELAYANPAARVLLSFDAPSSADALVHGLGDTVTEVSETARVLEVELRSNGQDLRVRASPTGSGEVVAVVTDVTEARRVEAVRRAFVTNASHELKTPVAGMQALADSLVLAVDRDPDRARRMLERLRGEAIRLARLVRDLLDLARLEEATAQRARKVELPGLVRSQVDRLAALAEERRVTLTLNLDPVASVVAEPEDVRIIVGNLLENAIRYNREGGQVRVTVERHGGEVSLEFADTGIGIPESERDRVFERFYRVDKGRSRAAGGTGLGLSLVRHAVERLDGRVTLASELGEGSTLVVVLPVEGSALDTP